ncbi:hypothetical protein XHC_1657 [Xanthomonas hortorum pv. carotae str. M081]|nr:hypothetical protein XHC_1657 [Xanthomonas hortorum pv. carotae str. M081]
MNFFSEVANADVYRRAGTLTTSMAQYPAAFFAAAATPTTNSGRQ